MYVSMLEWLVLSMGGVESVSREGGGRNAAMDEKYNENNTFCTGNMNYRRPVIDI